METSHAGVSRHRFHMCDVQESIVYSDLPVTAPGGEGKRAKTLSLQETGQRADSVHLAERSHSFFHLDIHTHPRERAGMGKPRGIGSGCEIHSAREEDTTQTVLNIEGAQGCSPWSPPQEGARDQSSSARRGLPSKGEARALHHQPAPASTLTTPCSLLSIARRKRNALKHYWEPRLSQDFAAAHVV